MKQRLRISVEGARGGDPAVRITIQHHDKRENYVRVLSRELASLIKQLVDAEAELEEGAR